MKEEIGIPDDQCARSPPLSLRSAGTRTKDRILLPRLPYRTALQDSLGLPSIHTALPQHPQYPHPHPHPQPTFQQHYLNGAEDKGDFTAGSIEMSADHTARHPPELMLSSTHNGPALASVQPQVFPPSTPYSLGLSRGQEEEGEDEQPHLCYQESASQPEQSPTARYRHPQASYLGQIPNPPGTKAKRKRASPHQLALLNQIFEYTFFPSTELRNAIGKELSMAPRTVQIWFQNRRQSWRSQKTREGFEDSPKSNDNERGGWEVLRSFQARRANGEIQEYEYMSTSISAAGSSSVQDPHGSSEGFSPTVLPYHHHSAPAAVSSNDQFNASMRQLPDRMPHAPLFNLSQQQQQVGEQQQHPRRQYYSQQHQQREHSPQIHPQQQAMMLQQYPQQLRHQTNAQWTGATTQYAQQHMQSEGHHSELHHPHRPR